MGDSHQTVPNELIEQKIYLVRGQKVMLDRDPAQLYGVETRVLNQAVRRNIERFPSDRKCAAQTQLCKRGQAARKPKSILSTGMPRLEGGKHHFMVTLTRDDIRNISQIVICSKIKHAKNVYAFTEQGVAMLSGILNSPRAIQVNIAIMRAFVRLRQMLATHADLAKKLEALERKYDSQFRVVFEAIRALMEEPVKPKRKIGFTRSQQIPA